MHCYAALSPLVAMPVPAAFAICLSVSIVCYSYSSLSPSCFTLRARRRTASVSPVSLCMYLSLIDVPLKCATDDIHHQNTSRLCPAPDECFAGYHRAHCAIATVSSPGGDASRPHVVDPRRPHCTHSTASTYAITSAALGKPEASQCVCTRSDGSKYNAPVGWHFLSESIWHLRTRERDR